jgi:adenosylmethionine-8-amino-7-oxononanoate aminotransferase
MSGQWKQAVRTKFLSDGCISDYYLSVAQALIDQLNDGVSYCHSLFYATNAAEQLASLLIDSTDGEMARAFFVSSGSEAIEAALKMARQYHLEKCPPEPQRVHFIGRQQSYHGTTLGALAAGGHLARRAIYEPMLSKNHTFVSPCFAYRGKASTETDGAYVRRLEDELDAEFQRIGPNNVAAFIAEPVVGAALGCVPSVSGYFKAARRVCDRYGALLVLDEIMCGSGRVGPLPSARYPSPLHAWQDPSVGVVPDLMTLGKGLGGGYQPIAAMLANRKVIDVLARGTGAFSHGQTYQAHPLACRAALEVQRIIRDEDLVSNVRVQGKLLGQLLRDKLSSHPHVGNIRGQGLFWGIEFVQDKATQTPFDPLLAVGMGVHELGELPRSMQLWLNLAQGFCNPNRTFADIITGMQSPFNISIYPGTGTADGVNGDHILLAPAYNVTSEDVRMIVDTTVSVIEAFFNGSIGVSGI